LHERIIKISGRLGADGKEFVPLNLEDAKKDLDVAFKQEFDQLLLS
jgi:5-oxoprolinase (ATP-hydrolysing)